MSRAIRSISLISASVLALTTPGISSAATITSESGFGSLGLGGTFESCKSGANTAAFSSGTLLSAGNYTGSCVGFFSATLDTSAKTITLSGLEAGNYETGRFSITGITGVTITGLTTLSFAPLFDPAVYAPNATDIPTPILSFTGDSIGIDFSSIDSLSGQFAYDANGGSAVFSYTTADMGAVPEPATWAMMIGGFGMVGASMRYRRRKTTVAFA